MHALLNSFVKHPIKFLFTLRGMKQTRKSDFSLDAPVECYSDDFWTIINGQLDAAVQLVTSDQTPR